MFSLLLKIPYYKKIKFKHALFLKARYVDGGVFGASVHPILLSEPIFDVIIINLGKLPADATGVHPERDSSLLALAGLRFVIFIVAV